MKIELISGEIHLSLSEDEFEMIRGSLRELPEAVDKHDCFLRTGYELSDFDTLRKAMFAFKLPSEES